MTNVFDELAALTNSDVAKEEEQRRGRSNFRHTLTEFIADVDGFSPIYEEKVGDRIRRRTKMQLSNVKVISVARDPYAEMTAEIVLPIPDAGGKPNINSEPVQTVLSAQKIKPDITSLPQLAGMKGVHFKELVHEFQGSDWKADPNGSRTNNQGQKGDWIDSTFKTYYYAVMGIGANSNGATAQTVSTPAEISSEANLALLGLLEGDGMTQEAFNLAAIKLPAVKADQVAVNAVVMETFLKDGVANGVITQDGDIFKV